MFRMRKLDERKSPLVMSWPKKLRSVGAVEVPLPCDWKNEISSRLYFPALKVTIPPGVRLFALPSEAASLPLVMLNLPELSQKDGWKENGTLSMSSLGVFSGLARIWPGLPCGIGGGGAGGGVWSCAEAKAHIKHNAPVRIVNFTNSS